MARPTDVQIQDEIGLGMARHELRGGRQYALRWVLGEAEDKPMESGEE